MYSTSKGQPTFNIWASAQNANPFGDIAQSNKISLRDLHGSEVVWLKTHEHIFWFTFFLRNMLQISHSSVFAVLWRMSSCWFCSNEWLGKISPMIVQYRQVCHDIDTKMNLIIRKRKMSRFYQLSSTNAYKLCIITLAVGKDANCIDLRIDYSIDITILYASLL